MLKLANGKTGDYAVTCPTRPIKGPDAIPDSNPRRCEQFSGPSRRQGSWRRIPFRINSGVTNVHRHVWPQLASSACHRRRVGRRQAAAPVQRTQTPVWLANVGRQRPSLRRTGYAKAGLIIRNLMGMNWRNMTATLMHLAADWKQSEAQDFALRHANGGFMPNWYGKPPKPRRPAMFQRN